MDEEQNVAVEPVVSKRVKNQLVNGKKTKDPNALEDKVEIVITKEE